MEIESFAAQRREQLDAGDEKLGPAVTAALADFGTEGWSDPILDVAERIWLENYVAEAPGAASRAGMARFRRQLATALDRSETVPNADRVMRWVSTYAVNSGTIQGAYRRGVRYKIWVDMEDDAVRSSHRHAAGQVVPIGGAFTVAGVKVAYPGEPVGDPSLYINCRCVAMPASRSGETMTDTTYDLGSNPHSRALVAAAGGEPRTGALVVLLPAESDPITAATSEDQAHMTTIWFGNIDELTVDQEELEQAVRLYAQDLDGPVVVPVKERGLLGDDDADVVFLEPTDSLLALRDGLLANEPIPTAYNAVEQYPEWTPHVTLGYPSGVENGPAVAEYDGTEVTFDRLGLWLGGDYTEYPMGGVVDDPITADAASDAQEPGIPAEEYIADDELEDDEEPIEEIPVHGVLAPEGVETGDGRGFREGALSSRPLPYPLRLETVGSHGGNNTSEVVTVGRIDEAWRDEATKQWRYRGAVILSKPGAAAAIQGIIDGSGRGVSIDADAMAVDMEGFTEEALAAAEAAGKNATTWFSEARIAGLTIVPIPAFHEAYIALGHEFEEDMSEEALAAAAAVLEDCGCGDGAQLEADVKTFAPGTHDGPGWITHPQATSRIRRYWTKGPGAAKIGYGTPGQFERCRSQLRKYVQNPEWLAGLCANMIKEVTGQWPGRQRGDKGRLASATSLAVRASGALAATAPALESAGIERVGLGEVVAISAGGASRKATKQVLSVGDRLKVTGSHAVPHAAEVVNVVPVGDFAVLTLVGVDVGADARPFAVVAAVQGADPEDVFTLLPSEVVELRLATTLWAPMGEDAPVVTLAHSLAEAPGATVAKFSMDAAVHATDSIPNRAALVASGAMPSPILNLVSADEEEGAIAASATFPGGYPAEWFANPRFREVTPLTIDKTEGRIYGHLAQWGVCHIGVAGKCVQPPHSKTGYANFLKGVVDTTAGEQRVGCLTYGIGHADIRLRMAAATAHYDQLDAVVAYVNVGEDSFGIWYSGVLAPDVDEDLIDKFRAVGAISGDWRPVGRYGHDLIAGVAVNTPGFPVAIAASAGEIQAIVAAGMVPQPERDPEPEAFADDNTEYLAKAVARALELRENKKREEAARKRALSLRQADVRRRIEKG